MASLKTSGGDPATELCNTGGHAKISSFFSSFYKDLAGERQEIVQEKVRLSQSLSSKSYFSWDFGTQGELLDFLTLLLNESNDYDYRKQKCR